MGRHWKSNNFYKRSDDYIQIVSRERKACWNVPYIWHALLIEKKYFKSSFFNENLDKGDGKDMAFCYNIRKSNNFMWLLNTEYFGYHREYVSLTSFLNNTIEWETKYLSKNFRENKEIINMGDDILKINMFSEEFCYDIIKLCEKSKLWSKGGKSYYDKRIGVIENHPTQDIQLNQINLEEMWKFIVKNYISKIMYEKYKYSTKDLNLSFVVKYDLDIQKELKQHHDSSSYTVNLCLNDQFEGGGCHFIHKNRKIINKEIGSILIHPGRVTHYHEGLMINSGVRYILVSFIN